MKRLALLFIVCLMIIGMAAAAGSVPLERNVRNISTANGQVTHVQQKEDNGFVEAIIQPIVRLIPGTNSSENPKVVQAEINSLNNEVGYKPSPCSDPTIEKRSEMGKIEYINVGIPDQGAWGYDSHFWFGMFIPHDTRIHHALLSDDPNVLSQMQTARIINEDITVSYYTISDPPYNFKQMPWQETGGVCSITVGHTG